MGVGGEIKNGDFRDPYFMGRIIYKIAVKKKNPKAKIIMTVLAESSYV